MKSPLRSETKEREPRHTASGPLRATKLRFTLLIASSGIVVLPSFRIGVTSTGSHLMGTYFQFSSVFDVRVSRLLGELLYICCRKDILDGLGDLRSDTITLDQCDGIFAL